MTASIKSSLVQLDNAIQYLEDKVVEVKATKKTAQADLFGSGTKSKVDVANDIDPKALAGRLDSAIAKVEKLLREG